SAAVIVFFNQKTAYALIWFTGVQTCALPIYSEDSAQSRRVGTIDENLAREYFPNQDPIGRRILVEDSPMEIVGVVGHTEQWAQDEKLSGSVKVQLYTLAEQAPDAWLGKGAGIVVRTEAPNYPTADKIRSAMQQMNHEQATYNFESMDQIIARSLVSRRFAMILLGVFAAIALVLASIGIYGVMSYVAGQQTHEIGLRMALGAQRRDVLKLVFGEAAMMVFAGLPIGLIAAGLLTELIKSLLFGISTTDPATFAAVAILLSAVAFAACYLPARRAMLVDPIVALRHE